MEILRSEIFRIISECGDALGIRTYVVGGWVRDHLLERECKDIDIVCEGDGIVLAKMVSGRMGASDVAVFKTFGTAQIKKDEHHIEFVGARKESYRSDSRNPDVTPGSIEDDIARRDFTMNAIAICLNKVKFGEWLDLFGGKGDIDAKLIRTPMEPGQTYSDDPLRMLRAVRFSSQLKFNIEAASLASIRENNQRLKIISMERVTEELNKIILSETPGDGIRILFETGLLHHILPELVLLQGVETVEDKSHKDNFYHTLQVLNNLSERSNDLWLRWAAILHDISKPETKRFEQGHGWTFHGHEDKGSRKVPKIFARLKLPLNEHMRFVQKLVLLHLRPIALTKTEVTDSAIRRLLFEAGNDIEALMMLCEADITSKNPGKVKRYLQNFENVRLKLREVEEKDKIRNWQPPVTGEMIMETFGLKPCKQVGILKTLVREAILDGLIPNDPEKAMQYMMEKGKDMGLVPVKNHP